MIEKRINIESRFDIEEFVDFAADYLGITSDATLRIYNDDRLLERFSRGGYEYQALLYKNALPKYYNLVVRSDVGAGIQGILAHEMVHLHQYISGRLWMNVETGAAVWDEVDYPSTIPYEKRPWEKEAFKVQRKLEKAWKKNRRRR